MVSRRQIPVALVALLLLLAASCIEKAPIQGAACDRTHPCPGQFSCAAGACQKFDFRPLARCFGDEDCSVGVCLVEAGFCVQCTEDVHCGGLGACLADSFVCGCTRGSQCATGRCDTTSGACVGCLASEQCESGICDRDKGVCTKIDGDTSAPEEKGGGRR